MDVPVGGLPPAGSVSGEFSPEVALNGFLALAEEAFPVGGELDRDTAAARAALGGETN